MSNNIYRLEEILKCQITGEWGTECEVDNGICILRTTNFTNIGEIDYSNVVKRNISPKKIETKRLVEDDIILEKSGGSDNIPVGRVVYCDARIGQKVYLCNNFTQVLRVDKSKAVAKYVFYFLLFQHKRGYTELLQNKTTGIRNLQLKAYMEMRIPIPPIEEQKKIAEILDKASNLISLRKKQTEKLELLIKARFIEMFGYIKTNDKGWNCSVVNDVIDSITAGWSGNGEAREKKEDEKAVLKVSAVTQGVFNAKEYKVLDSNTRIKKYVYPQKGDLLFSRANTRELVGATCIIYQDYPDLLLPDKLWKIKFNNKVNVFYMKYILSETSIRANMAAQSTGTSGSMYNISMDKFKNIVIPLPPIELQNQFADFVQLVDKQKEQLQKGLEKLELTYKALMQQYFN